MRWSACTLCGILLFGTAVGLGESPAEVLASIRLYNPTSWDGPTPIEVPIGHLATPGVIDWTRVRVQTESGIEVPFAIREGRPHWKARLTAPIESPRAEDLLVLSLTLAPRVWSRIDVVPGPGPREMPVVVRGDLLVVSYPNLETSVDRSTGMLVQVVAFGEPMLDAPLSIEFRKRVEGGGPPQALGAVRVRLATQTSTSAMTEFQFVLEVDERLSILLSYRIHASGAVEIWADERPWQGTSPWVDREATFRLEPIGRSEPLYYLLNRAPFYGFKDYAAAVRHVAEIRHSKRVMALVLGEETTNGRRWNRRLTFVAANEKDNRAADSVANASGDAADRIAQMEALVLAADEGLIIDPSPRTVPLASTPVRIASPRSCTVPTRTLAEALERKGVTVQWLAPEHPIADASILFRLKDPRETPGIEGDGFEVSIRSGSTPVEISASTLAGLMQAALRVAEHLVRSDGPVRLPLIASNPAVAVRGAGFGGGDHEVDFPYGTDLEWETTLDTLVSGGMNVMADLGMWSNWKMPVSYRLLPELQSDSPEAYDEVSGARLAEFEDHRRRGLRLLEFLHARGVKVWLWLPVGCVPTTYARKHPEAMAPGNDRCPCFTHPFYARYLEGFLGEVLETYPIDGVVMIRDDNGGLCPCERCAAQVAASPTRSAAWEQYLILYRWMRAKGFRGDLAVYPYFDAYEPRLDPLLPPDLWIVGHGSGAGMLSRNYETLAPMGDTWLDNVLAGFRVPTAARMRRLLADRNSFWLGGALRGSELAWQAIGGFGWEPTATVNSLRFREGARHFGAPHALAFADFAEAYERMWEVYDHPLLPEEWVRRTADERREIAVQGHAQLRRFRERLEVLRRAVDTVPGDPWFAHVALLATYFEVHLRRLELFSLMCDRVAENKASVERGEALPEPIRQDLLRMHTEVYARTVAFDMEAAKVPGAMIARTRALGLTLPFKELVAGYDVSLEGRLETRQFAGALEAQAEGLAAGQPFTLRIRMVNSGVCPWIQDVGHRLELGGDAARLGLPLHWDYESPSMVFGDRREIELRGMAPAEAGKAVVRLSFLTPFRNAHAFLRKEVEIVEVMPTEVRGGPHSSSSTSDPRRSPT